MSHIRPAITHRFAADDFEETLAGVADRESGKVILDRDAT